MSDPVSRLNAALEGRYAIEVILVTNWFEELRQRMGN